jgi:hypothetical protein
MAAPGLDQAPVAPDGPPGRGPRFTVAGGIGTTFAVLWAHAGRLGVTVGLAQLPLLAQVATVGTAGLAYPIVKAATAFVQSALVAAAVEAALLGRRPHPVTATAAVGPRLLVLIGVTLATAVATGLGLALLLVPGLIVAAGLYVAVPVVLAEPALGVRRALARSWALTRGRRLPVLAVDLFAVVVLLLCALLAWLLLLPMPELPLHGRELLSELVALPAVMFFSAAPAVVYRQLRREREGDGSASPAA